MNLPPLPTSTFAGLSDLQSGRVPLYTQYQMNQYGQACFDEGVSSVHTLEPMAEVADRYAHRMALELECVLADRPGYYDKAMQVLGEYRSAMNAIHEQHSQTHMGEPLLHNAEVKGLSTRTPCYRAGTTGD